MKTTITTLLLITSIAAAQSSPRLSYLDDKIRSAYTVESQLRSQYQAVKAAYNSAKARTTSLRKERKSTAKREAREYEAARKRQLAAQKEVSRYMSGDMTAPTTINWRSN